MGHSPPSPPQLWYDLSLSPSSWLPSSVQQMSGFIKGLTAADIPGTNNFVQFIFPSPEPVSITPHVYVHVLYVHVNAFELGVAYCYIRTCMCVCVCVCVYICRDGCRCWLLTSQNMQDKLWHLLLLVR